MSDHAAPAPSRPRPRGGPPVWLWVLLGVGGLLLGWCLVAGLMAAVLRLTDAE